MPASVKYIHRYHEFPSIDYAISYQDLKEIRNSIREMNDKQANIEVMLTKLAQEEVKSPTKSRSALSLSP